MTHQEMTVEEFNAARGMHKAFSNQPTRPRSQSGVMNKTEQRMAEQLRIEQMSGVIRWWAFDSINLKLADKTWYRPDFFIVHSDGRMEFRETKGHWEDDARVKFKVAAEAYPMFSFTAYKPTRGGGWHVETKS